MKIQYTRRGGHRPPRDDERLEIEDGQFTMWRTVSSATYPPTPVGAFAGKVPDAQWEALQEAASAAKAAGDFDCKISPDSPVESIAVGDISGRLGIHDEPDGAWGELVAKLRALLGELTDQPRAALAVKVGEDSHSAALERLGEEPLYVDLSWGDVRAVLWEDEWQNKGSWTGAIEGGAGEETSGGWRVDLPFDHGFSPEENQEVVAYVTLKLRRDGTEVPVSLESPRK